MKKYFLLFLTALFLIGCGTNSDYIETTTSIILPNKLLNANSVEDLTKEILTAVSGEDVNKEKIKWEVQGNTKNGKVITAAFKNHVVHIPVENDGDYIEVTPVNIYVITDGKEKISLSDILEY